METPFKCVQLDTNFLFKSHQNRLQRVNFEGHLRVIFCTFLLREKKIENKSMRFTIRVSVSIYFPSSKAKNSNQTNLVYFSPIFYQSVFRYNNDKPFKITQYDITSISLLLIIERFACSFRIILILN